jgi:hypothetical protein
MAADLFSRNDEQWAKIEKVGCCPKLNPIAIFRSRQVHASFNINELEPVEREKGEQPNPDPARLKKFR